MKEEFNIAAAEKQIIESRLFLCERLYPHQVRMAGVLFGESEPNRWINISAPPAFGKTHFLKASPRIVDLYTDSSILHFTAYQNYKDVMLEMVYSAIDDIYKAMPTTRYKEGKTGTTRLRRVIVSHNLYKDFDDSHKNKVVEIRANGGVFENLIRTVSAKELPQESWFEPKNQYLIFTSSADLAKLFVDFYDNFLKTKLAKKFMIRCLIDEAHSGGAQTTRAKDTYINKRTSSDAYSVNAESIYKMFRHTGLCVGYFSGTPSNEHNAEGFFCNRKEFIQFKPTEDEIISMKLKNSYLNDLYDAESNEEYFVKGIALQSEKRKGVIQVFLPGGNTVDGITIERFSELAEMYLSDKNIMYWDGCQKYVRTKKGEIKGLLNAEKPQTMIDRLKVDVLVVVNLLGTGFDYSNITTVAFGYRFAFNINKDYCSPIQKIGRGLRACDTPLDILFFEYGEVEAGVIILAQCKYNLFFGKKDYFAAKESHVPYVYKHVSDAMFDSIVESVRQDVGIGSKLSNKLNSLVNHTKHIDQELYGVTNPFDIETINRARVAEVSAATLMNNGDELSSLLLGGTTNRADAYAHYEPSNEYCALDVKTMLTVCDGCNNDFKQMATLRSTGEIKTEMVYILYDMGYDTLNETFSVKSIYVFTLTADNVKDYVVHGKINKNCIRNEDVRSIVVDI